MAGMPCSMHISYSIGWLAIEQYHVFVSTCELMREKCCASRRTMRAYQHNSQIPPKARLADCASESRLANGFCSSTC
jgi:hypothetical protein